MDEKKGNLTFGKCVVQYTVDPWLTWILKEIWMKALFELF